MSYESVCQTIDKHIATFEGTSIMKRNKRRWAFIGIMLMRIVLCGALKCDRKPRGSTGLRSNPENKFRLLVDKNPTSYQPEQWYTVILQGTHNVKEPTPYLFNGFSLVVDPADVVEKNVSRSMRSAGTFFVAGDANAKIDDYCPNMVVHTSHAFVPKIKVAWQAPPFGTGCVIFRAAVMEQNTWYMDDRGLSLKLCEGTNVEQFPTLDQCCACYEAKYEMKFEGLWTRQNHPKGFPSNVWLTRFSDVIGVSHTVNYRFWRPNETASPGLVQFCETDNSAALESEIKRDGTRTVIKAKGIAYPNITGKTFAVFRVDPIHHLLSIVSMIRPSPDWFVGIFGLELCEESCSWVKYRELDLYPWDLGIYTDVEYNSRNSPNPDQDKIYRIGSLYPNDTNSPFYDPTGTEIKPMARLYLTFQKQYETNCSNVETNDVTPEEMRTTEYTVTEEYTTAPVLPCEPENWTDKSKCNCDTGKQIAYRMVRNENGVCSEEVIFKDCTEECERLKEQCKTTEWSAWSECSTSNPPCGVNVEARFRTLSTNGNNKNCRERVELEQVRPCKSVSVTCSDPEQLEARCPMTEWSAFTPCNGKSRTRTRKLKEKGNYKICGDLASRQAIKCDCEESECTGMPA